MSACDVPDGAFHCGSAASGLRFDKLSRAVVWGVGVLGAEVAVGYALAYLGRKLRRTAGQLDDEVDRSLDAGMARVHSLVSRALSDDPALRLAEAEAASEPGVSDRTRSRLVLALEEAVEADGSLLAALEQEIKALRATTVASQTAVATGDGIAVAGPVTFNTDGGPAALRMADVTVNPQAPGAP